ncbi:MAG: AMP-binding protein, partial [Nannocystaceae bacterium]
MDLFSARVASDPDAPALRFKEGHVWRTLSWRDWEHTSRQLAAALIRHYKIAPGDRVAMMAKTRVEWALMDLAIALTGAVSVPIYPTVMPAEVGLILGDSDCVLALVDTPETAERLLAAHAGNGVSWTDDTDHVFGARRGVGTIDALLART